MLQATGDEMPLKPPTEWKTLNYYFTAQQMLPLAGVAMFVRFLFKRR